MSINLSVSVALRVSGELLTLRKPVWISYPRSTDAEVALGGPVRAKEMLLRVNRPKIKKRECIVGRILPKLFHFGGEPLLSEEVD